VPPPVQASRAAVSPWTDMVKEERRVVLFRLVRDCALGVAKVRILVYFRRRNDEFVVRGRWVFV
jgi:hypothetical protein